MKVAFAREFLWFLFAAIISFPLALLFLKLLDIATKNVSDEELAFAVDLFIIGYIISFVGIYLIRMLVGAFKALSAKKA